MKKGWKLFWIICGIVFCLGVIFCIAGRTMGVTFYDMASVLDDKAWLLSDMDLSALGIDDDEDGSMEVQSRIDKNREYAYGERAGEPDMKKSYSGIQKVDVDAAGIQLQVLPSPDQDVHVEAVNVDAKLRFKCVQNKERLDITTTKKIHTINRIKGYATVWLLLPEEQLKELELTNEAGEVYVSQADALEFSMEVGAGEAIVEKFTAKEADLECGAGSLQAAGTILSKGDIGCGVGEVVLTLFGNEEDYRYDVECGIGEVTVGGRSVGGMGISESDLYDDDDHDDYDDDDDHDNDVTHHNSGENGGRELSIECGIGSVNVNFER